MISVVTFLFTTIRKFPSWLSYLGLILIFLIIFPSALAQDQAIYESHAPIPTPRQEAALVSLDEKIYVIGGFHETKAESIDIVEVYDSKTDTWSSVSSLPKKLNHVGAAEYDGKIYVVGGFEYTLPLITHWRATDYLFIYDPVSDQWTRGADMPTPRGALTAEFIGNTLYAVGGNNLIPNKLLSLVFNQISYPINEAYDPESDTWSKKAPMPTPRDHAASAVIDEKLYVIGGRQSHKANKIGANEVYDPKTDSWSVLEPIPTPRSGGTASVLNNTIFVFGGEDDQKVYDENEQYVPGVGWFSQSPMPTPRHAFDSAVVGNRIYLMGGDPSNEITYATSLNESYFNPNVIPDFGSLALLVFALSLLPILFRLKTMHA